MCESLARVVFNDGTEWDGKKHTVKIHRNKSAHGAGIMDQMETFSFCRLSLSRLASRSTKKFHANTCVAEETAAAESS